MINKQLLSLSRVAGGIGRAETRAHRGDHPIPVPRQFGLQHVQRCHRIQHTVQKNHWLPGFHPGAE